MAVCYPVLCDVVRFGSWQSGGTSWFCKYGDY